ncbi:MAG: ATP-binding protein [Myxococcota bacterium]
MESFDAGVNVAGFALSLFSTLALLHLFRWHRKSYLKIWTVAFGALCVRYTFSLGGDLDLIADVIARNGGRIANVCAALMAVVGAHAFLGRKTPGVWIAWAGAALIWVGIAPSLEVTGLAQRFPLFAMLGVLLIVSGFRVFGSSMPSFGRVLTACALCCFGVYAMIRVLPSVERLVGDIDLGIDLALAGTTAIGILIMHFELAEKAEHRARSRLERAARMESLGRMAGGVAHDFNNLLTVIMGSLELAAEPGSEQEQQEHLQQATRAGQRAAELTHQLLLFSRNQPAQIVLVDIVALCRRTSDLMRRLLPESIRLDVDLPDSELNVRGVPTQLEQMLINLGVNARDAMPNGGTVRVRVRGDGERVRLEFADTGTGIVPEMRDKIFEPFFTTKEPGRGTGLGLSMAYGLIQQMSGQISVHASEEGGAKFDIELPMAAPGSEPNDTSEEIVATHRGEALSILLAEDDAAVRSVMVRFLEGDGHRVVSTGNAPEALSAARTEKFDVVVTDFVMPGMSGRELLDSLRDVQGQARFLMISGYAEWADQLPEDVAFLSKPFSAEQLRAFIEGGAEAPTITAPPLAAHAAP